jgi:hypothetical protein
MDPQKVDQRVLVVSGLELNTSLPQQSLDVADLHGLRPAILILKFEIGAAALRAQARRERILNATSINHG